VEEENWACLIGLPETALNNLASRFDENIVPDLPGFLRQNWAMALYHDRFNEFRAVLREEFEDDKDFAEALTTAGGSTSSCGPASFDVGRSLKMLPVSKCDNVRRRLRDYIHANKNHLEMYVAPSSGMRLSS